MIDPKSINSYLFIKIGLFFLIACSNNRNEEVRGKSIHQNGITSKLAQNKEELKTIKYQNDTTKKTLKVIAKNSNKQQDTSFLSIDTVSLGNFWSSFQKNIRANNKRKVIDVLEFPIHAIFLVTFQFSYDCDTAKFILNENKYLGFDIDKNNVQQHYDLIFSKILKEMILNTSLKDLTEKRLESDGKNFTYAFFVRDFKPKGKCYFDHRIYFYFNQLDKNWKIAIGGE